MNSHSPQANKLNAFPDNKRIISLILKYWYVFALSALLAYFIVLIQLKFTPNVYQGSLTILLESSKDNRITQSEMVEGFVMGGESNNIDNQSLIIQSRATIKKTIDRLDFGVSIFQRNQFLDQELYGEAPFNVLIDSLAPQLLNTPITIIFTSKDKLLVSIKCEGGNLFQFKEQEYLNSIGPIEYEHVISINEPLKEEFASFLVTKMKGYEPLLNKEYYIVFNSNDDILSSFVGRVNVSPLRESSSIITVSTTGYYPKKLTRFLDELSKVYLEQNLEKKNNYANRTLGFINVQLAQISDSLNKTRDELMAFRTQNKFVSPSDFSQKISEEYYLLDKERMENVYKLEFFQALNQKLKDNPLSDDYLLPIINDETNPFISTTASDLLKLKTELDSKENYGSISNPAVQDMREIIERQKITLCQLIDKYIQNISLKIKTIDRSRADIIAQMDNMPMIERKYMDLERTYKLNDAIYTFLLQKQSETQITKSSNTPDNEVVDQARVVGPISPNSRQQTTQAIIIGLLLPLVIIIAIDFINNHLHTQEELKALIPDVPLIGLVPCNKTGSQNVLLSEPSSAVSESFRTIRNKMKFMVTNSKLKVITITSSNTGEGKTFVAINMATAFSLSGNKTVLVGFDLRRPRLNEVFQHHSIKGVSNYLVDQASLDEIIIPSDSDNLFIIPSGPIPPNPSELILGERTNQLFSELREQFDIIIVDSPPIGLVSDARILIDHGDSVLFVVRENYSKRDQVVNSINHLIHEKISGMGLIFNNVTGNNNRYGYGYYS